MNVQMPTQVRAALGAERIELARRSYDSPGRHYHTWTHIEACLREAATLDFDDPLALYAALLYHDAIYVAGAKDNEARSAQLAASQLQGCAAYSPESIRRIDHLILLTASHGALPDNAPHDDQLLIDIDLSILATAPAIYDGYARQVRDEWVPGVASDAQYAQGRAAFLRGMLKAPRIFHSAEFKVRESAARANIARELAALQA